MTFASSQNEVWIGLQSTVLCVSVDQMEVIARVPMRVGVAGKAIPSSLSYIQQTQQIWCSVCTEPSIMVWDVPSRRFGFLLQDQYSFFSFFFFVDSGLSFDFFF